MKQFQLLIAGGLEIAVFVVIGAWLGQQLDQWLFDDPSKTPLGLFVGTLAGFGAGIRVFLTLLRAQNAKAEEE